MSVNNCNQMKKQQNKYVFIIYKYILILTYLLKLKTIYISHTKCE